MELDIRPFEMTRGGEVVFGRDRRCLRFACFVTGFVVSPYSPQSLEELLRLLEICPSATPGLN